MNMIPEEFKKKVIEFEFMMQEYHKYNTWYDRYGLSWFSEFASLFIKSRKHKPSYHEILDDLEAIKGQLTQEEYSGLRNRIISAYGN